MHYYISRNPLWRTDQIEDWKIYIKDTNMELNERAKFVGLKNPGTSI